jgi:hypothetical protein
VLCELQEKSSSYECFHAHNDIVTLALFAPGTARRTQKLPSRAMAQNSKVGTAVHTLKGGSSQNCTRAQFCDSLQFLAMERCFAPPVVMRALHAPHD